MKTCALALVATCSLLTVVLADPAAVQPQNARQIAAEQALANTISETRMVETVRRLVGFGTRMYGTPSNHEATAWLASAFREAGLEVTVRQDPARDWYQPISWQVRTIGGPGGPEGVPLKTTWPSIGAPSGKGEGPLSTEAAPGAVCLVSANPTPETTTGCIAVLFDGRVSASGWPGINRLRGSWSIPVFVVAPREANPLRERLKAGDKVRVSFALEAKSGNDVAHTVVATLPGRDRSKYVLFCAHGDADSGGPGADDNASGDAIVLETARAAAAAVRARSIPQPAWDLRFAVWGGEMSSSREYVVGMDKDSSRLQAVFNFDQSGFGSSKDALYVEPDEVAVNKEIITTVRAVMKDHLGTRGFPQHAASVRGQGGTDSYVFQNSRSATGPMYPAISLYTSAWDRERTVPVTDGFPPFNWYPEEKPGTVTVDGDPFYHSVGDTPANTTDTEPFNMGWCARVALLSALRFMAGS